MYNNIFNENYTPDKPSMKIKLLEAIMYHYINHCKNDEWVTGQAQYSKYDLQYSELFYTIFKYYPNEYKQFDRVYNLRKSCESFLKEKNITTIVYKNNTPIFYFLEMYLEIVFGFTFVVVADVVGFKLFKKPELFSNNILSFCYIFRLLMDKNISIKEEYKYLNKEFFSSGENIDICIDSEKILTVVHIGLIDHIYIKQYDLDEKIVSLSLLYNIAECFYEFHSNPSFTDADSSKNYNNETAMKHKYAEKFCINSGYSKEDIINMNKMFNIIRNNFNKKEYNKYYRIK